MHLTPADGPVWTSPTYESPEQVLEVFDVNVRESRAAIETASDAELMQPWTLKSGDQVHFTMPRIACIHLQSPDPPPRAIHRIPAHVRCTAAAGVRADGGNANVESLVWHPAIEPGEESSDGQERCESVRDGRSYWPGPTKRSKRGSSRRFRRSGSSRAQSIWRWRAASLDWFSSSSRSK
ncbi:MAG: hypothetical protein ACI841_002459 [Planctomycetota bacterium]|jgi:hypothetical protein